MRSFINIQYLFDFSLQVQVIYIFYGGWDLSITDAFKQSGRKKSWRWSPVNHADSYSFSNKIVSVFSDSWSGKVTIIITMWKRGWTTTKKNSPLAYWHFCLYLNLWNDTIWISGSTEIIIFLCDWQRSNKRAHQQSQEQGFCIHLGQQALKIFQFLPWAS